MDNLRISLPLVDGSLMPYECSTGKELIQALFSDDIAPPPRGLSIEAQSEDGQTVRLFIPFDDSPKATVAIKISEDWKRCPDCQIGFIYVWDSITKKTSAKPCKTCGGLGRVEDR